MPPFFIMYSSIELRFSPKCVSFHLELSRFFPLLISSLFSMPAFSAWLKTKCGASMMMPRGMSVWMKESPRFHESGTPNTLPMMRPTRKGFHTKLELRI